VTRSGVVALAGRPNVGKSTLLNLILGEKVVIVSDRPQTTRRAVRGTHTMGDRQIVLVDLPGVQRPRDPLTTRMTRRMHRELEASDVALLILNGEQGVGPGDRFIARVLRGTDTPVTIAVNKIDRLSQAGILTALQQAAGLEVGEDVFPISASTGAGVQELTEHLAAQVPEAPFLVEGDAVSDQPLDLLVAELVREAVIRRTFQEVPHSVEVVVEEIERRSAGLTRVTALVWVENDSQRRILLGARGAMIRAIGTAARREIERELQTRVFLELSVRVLPDWRADERLLDRLGIT
jgi:GTP-binding protein Era